jgi:hypothetical protein
MTTLGGLAQGAQAARANAQRDRGVSSLDAHFLQVAPPKTVCGALGMAYIVPELEPLAAKITVA